MATPQQSYMSGYRKKPGIVRRAGQVAAGAGVLGAAAVGVRNRKTLGWAAQTIRGGGGVGSTLKRARKTIGTTARADIYRGKQRLGMAPKGRVPRSLRPAPLPGQGPIGGVRNKLPSWMPGSTKPKQMKLFAGGEMHYLAEFSEPAMMGDASDMAEFARRGRKRGSRDKKPRRRRGMMIGGGVAAAGTLGAAGRYGMAAIGAGRSNAATNSAASARRPFGARFLMPRPRPTGVSNTSAALAGAQAKLVSDAGTVRNSATAMGRGINARSRKAVGTINNSARSVGGMLKGRKGLALAGASVAAAGLYGVARARNKKPTRSAMKRAIAMSKR